MSKQSIGILLALTLFVGINTVRAADKPAGDLKWEIKLLTIDRNEGIDVADFNNDGKLDVAAGRNWYAAPDFVPRPLRLLEDWNGYAESNGDFAFDVDGDGLTDVISGSFIPTEVNWYRNPGLEGLETGALWEKQLLVDTQESRNESQHLGDLDGDGVPEWVVNSWAKNVPMLAWKFGKEEREFTVKKGKKEVTEKRTVPTLKRFIINDTGNGHGSAFGDINGDGRLDILCGLGWYEQPADGAFAQQWTFHADWDIHSSNPCVIVDVNQDGKNDIIWGNAHNFGLYWWEQTGKDEDGKITWKDHLIDDTFSQPHCLHMADLDGDGKDELVTGKRVYAHNGKDPGGKMQPCLYYYTIDGKAGKFTRHTINEGRVGSGLQIRTVDLNGDGRLDIAVAGKSGTYLLFNQGK